jgi:branched-chain amino acid transport system ATP-binding protein
MALKYADYGYIMESGRVVMDGAASDLANNEDVKEFYLGMGGGERKSFKDGKSYKRRKTVVGMSEFSQKLHAARNARTC